MKFKYVSVILSLLIISTIIIVLITSTGNFNKIPHTVSSKTDDKIEIKFLTSWGGTDTKASSLEQILEKFQKDNPDIKIKNESMSGDEFLFTLKTDFAEGNEPDVFGLWPGSDMISLINTGKVADLTDILKNDSKWYSQFGKESWAYDTFNKKIYGLPCEIIYEGLYVNKDLFDKYSVKIPTNFSELEAAIKTFRQNNIIPIAYNSSTAEGTYLYQNIVMKLGGKAGTETPYVNDKFNKYYVNGLEYLKHLYDLGAFPANAFTIDDNARNQLFRNKKAAMIVQGSWFVGDGSIASTDSSVKIVPFPDIDGEASKPGSIIYGIGNGDFHMSTAASKNDKKRAACLKLLKMLTSIDTWKYFSKKTGLISNVNTSNYISSDDAVIKDGFNLVNNSPELVGPPDSFVDRSSWENILVKEMPIYLNGEISADAIFDEMNKERLQKLNNGRFTN